MSAPFASTSWLDELASAIRSSTDVRAAAASWVYGPIALVFDGSDEHGVEAAAVRIDVQLGEVRSVEAFDPARSALVPFVLSGSLDRWRAVFAGSLEPYAAILEAKLRSRGDLPTLQRSRDLLAAIAAAGGTVSTIWQDEQEPASASAG